MNRTDGSGSKQRQCTDGQSLDRQPTPECMHMCDFIGFRPEIALRSQRKSVQYEPNINHISKNNIPAAPLNSAISPSPFLAASTGVCSIKHSPPRGAGMYQGKVKNRIEACLLQTMQNVQLFVKKDNEAG